MTAMLLVDPGARTCIPTVDHTLSSRKDQAYLQMALKLAAQSTQRRKHGAVVVRGSSILGTGYNRFRNCPVVTMEPFIMSIHAEVRAIAMVSNQELLNGATIYVARVNNAGITRYSAPCPQCAKLVDLVGIKRVVHT